MTDESVIEIILETFLQKCNENRWGIFVFIFAAAKSL